MPIKTAELVDAPARLPDVLAALAPLETLAVDTEFLWERTYHPKLAVLQVAGRDAEGHVVAFALDALALELEPLLDLLREPSRLKVFHSGRIDLQILHRRLGAPLTPVFDTQRAAALLGHGQQVGYANLVEAMLGLHLEKTEQYTDWTRRPLSPAQVEYALQDVIPLLEVHDALTEHLARLQRAEWAQEEMADLVCPTSYVEEDPRELYLKVKTMGQLRDRRQLGILRELTVWREREARERDLRPTFVVKDQALVELSKRAPKNRRALEDVRALHPKDRQRHADALVKVIRHALDLPDHALPPAPKRRRPKQDVSATVELLRAFLAQRSTEAQVAPEILATVSDLERLARDSHRERYEHDHKLLTGWRRDLVGDELLRILRGELTVGVDPDSTSLRLVEPPM